MNLIYHKTIIPSALILMLFWFFVSTNSHACGGFFCQLTPINQAGEQIVFKQEGETTTALILIQYQGEAKDFSWVLPVPGIPELRVGSELIFPPLELATRPQFDLNQTGEMCPSSFDISTAIPASTNESDDTAGTGVTVLQTVSVGPFDAQVIASDDATALATWLSDNNFNLSSRGEELIAPYVTEGMNFVTLKLSKDKESGDIQPLLLNYNGTKPTIPLRLTAVAAQDDMGILVWIIGTARAVPINYLHVIPNYTRLNWYSGTRNAYSSYQNLITSAMNEAGGQGFATDYAGKDLAYIDLLPKAQPLIDTLADFANINDDALFLTSLYNGTIFPAAKVLGIFQRHLPLNNTLALTGYASTEILRDQFTDDQLTTARISIVEELEDTVITPLSESLALFNQDQYLTRLYTTLSADEMTLDPLFDFNPDLKEQPLLRQATLNSECKNNQNLWTLTLGPGTDRDGEIVIDASSQPPLIAQASEQRAVWRSENIGSSGQPDIVSQNSFSTLEIGNTAQTSEKEDQNNSDGFFGAAVSNLGLMIFGMILIRYFTSPIPNRTTGSNA